MKMDAVALLQEWVQGVGSKAGLTSANTRLSSGAVGIPESRLEVPETLTREATTIGTCGCNFVDNSVCNGRNCSLVTI